VLAHFSRFLIPEYEAHHLSFAEIEPRLLVFNGEAQFPFPWRARSVQQHHPLNHTSHPFNEVFHTRIQALLPIVRQNRAPSLGFQGGGPIPPPLACALGTPPPPSQPHIPPLQ
jgi:hypothetical protein